MTEIDQATAAQEAAVRGLLLVGGTVKEVITSTEAEGVRDHLSSLLQVKNLVVLLGSGASFHLGSPQTRNLSNTQVLGLIADCGATPSDSDAALLATINPTDNGDLEQLLNGLQLAVALAAHSDVIDVVLGSGDAAKSYPKDQVDGLRRRINRALADACRLPRRDSALEPPFDSDPFFAHRTFFARIVRSRRTNLPRPRVVASGRVVYGTR